MVTAAGGRSKLDAGSFVVWPAEDSLRLVCLLQACSSVPLLLACQSTRRQYSSLVDLRRKAEADPDNFQAVLEARGALASLELALADAEDSSAAPDAVSLTAAPSTLESSLAQLTKMEKEMHVEMWYVYGHDWEPKPGRLISRKGTWLKKSTCFSWEISEEDKLYVPHGVSMPILQIGQVTSPAELERHEWTTQHRRVWVMPAIIRALEARRGVWFIFGPHWEVLGDDIVPAVDTWLKRSCQMSGELQPFEMVYMPKDVPVRLLGEPKIVVEEWEKSRHPHVQQHRRVTLAGQPLTVKQEKYDIFVGQSEE